MSENSNIIAKKSEPARLDKKDKEILSMLYLDSRIGYSAIGKKVGLSGPSVERRIARLKSDGVIISLFANICLPLAGRKSVRFYLKFDHMDKRTERQVAAMFRANPNTGWGMIGEGAYDVIWRIDARSEADIAGAFSEITRRFGRMLAEKSFTLTTYQAYLPWNKAFGTQRHVLPQKYEFTAPAALDSADLGILSMLSADARASTVSIARKIGLSPDAARLRIARLVNMGVISGFSAYYDTRRLGLDYYKILVSFRNMSEQKEREFLSYCMENDNVVFVNKTIGEWEMEIDIVSENNARLHEFMIDLKSRFGGQIGRHAFLSAVYEVLPNPLGQKRAQL
ncbi:MAG TPA: Lrp/AsnC family transcriptional regulator [Candidatus Micrarchaeota archaeon]|nr:Lrp/AsnC family transcriptional regulator [Candidatus Micrarchaeota archaeon]